VKKEKAFTLIELLVVIAIIAVLMGILMPSLQMARKQARKTACMSSVRSFALAFNVYGAENDNAVIPLYFENEGKFWPEKLKDFYNDDGLRLCPEAIKPRSSDMETPHGALGMANIGGPYNAWYHVRTSGDQANKKFLGSYGTNGWIHKGVGQTWGFDYKNHWGVMSVKGASKIPLMLDCTWVAGYPLDTDSPTPANQYYSWTSQMSRYCFWRHKDIINTSFMDGSTRAVRLADLWTLKWHRSFNPQHDIEIPKWENR
jgi:prepilin-type N-terminal cleavage/methylation domain-containing protein